QALCSSGGTEASAAADAEIAADAWFSQIASTPETASNTQSTAANRYRGLDKHQAENTCSNQNYQRIRVPDYLLQADLDAGTSSFDV
ncbi:MAG: hypothetical protein WBX10_07345, partial [Candidatus Sulfotelmatobacter sp.]